MNTIIVYASMTGTTELMARSIADSLRRTGDQVVIKDAIDSYADELKNYERILVGSCTWGDGDLSDEIADFHDELLNIDLSGKMAAAFGSGDSNYEHFARAVDILEETLRNQGCVILTKGLKIDKESHENLKEQCELFTRSLSHFTD